MTIARLAELLMKAHLPEPEREAWIQLVPYLPKHELLKLGEILEKDVQRFEALSESLRAEYKVIKKTEELREARSHLA